MHMQIVTGERVQNEHWTNCDLSCAKSVVIFDSENSLTEGGGLVHCISVGAIQIVRDLCIFIGERHILLPAFQQVNVYSTDLTIIFEFLCNSNSFPFSLLPCVPTISYLYWTTKNRTCYMQKALVFVDTPKLIFHKTQQQKRAQSLYVWIRSKAFWWFLQYQNVLLKDFV